MSQQVFEDALDMSIYAMQKGEKEPAPLKERDTWWCRKCRHTFRRALAHGPVRWRCYATAGQVSEGHACPACRKRLAALHGTSPRQRTVGIRIQGVDG